MAFNKSKEPNVKNERKTSAKVINIKLVLCIKPEKFFVYDDEVL